MFISRITRLKEQDNSVAPTYTYLVAVVVTTGSSFLHHGANLGIVETVV